MDINKLYSTIHWLDYSSFTLNTERFVILSNSLLLLQNENHSKKIYFWGIIQCIELDYYIAYGFKNDCILDRTYFYSENCQEWKVLPTPKREHITLSSLCRKPFQGDPGLIIEIVDDAPPEDESLDDGYKEIDEDKNENMAEQHSSTIEQSPLKLEENVVELPIESGELKEEDRLAATVNIITEETAINPRGGVFKQADGVNVQSQAFEGISLDEVDELCSFQHCRVPKQEWNTNLLTRIDYNYALDFLDTIDNDLTNDCWQAQVVEGNRAVILRNLHWPGFMFFHHIKTPDYGCIYIGNGQRNLDIPFMTQVRDISHDIAKEKNIELQKISNMGLSRMTMKSIEKAMKEEPILRKGSEQAEVGLMENPLFETKSVLPEETKHIEEEIITSA